jgi:hypothetical protein
VFCKREGEKKRENREGGRKRERERERERERAREKETAMSEPLSVDRACNKTTSRRRIPACGPPPGP